MLDIKVVRALQNKKQVFMSNARVNFFVFFMTILGLGLGSCSKNGSCGESVDYEDTSSLVGFIEENKEVVITTECNNTKTLIERVSLKKLVGTYEYFRIPSIIVTNEGTTLLACENREVLWDKGKIDILVSRQNNDSFCVRKVFDNGKVKKRSMNPVFLIDREGRQGKKGRIYLFTCYLDIDSFATSVSRENADFVYKYSDDDGKSWSPEYSLKPFWSVNDYSFCIPSPANGIVDEKGTFILPTMVVVEGKWRSGIVYKRSGYSEWVFSRPTPHDGDNESTVYVDPNGQIILDCRIDDDNHRNRYIYDMDTDSFSELPVRVVPLPLKAEITECVIDGTTRYLTTYVDSERNKRENITLYSSADGNHWSKVGRLQFGDLEVSAYSNANSFNGKTVFCYENNYEIRAMDISCLNNDIVSLGQ